MRTGLTPRSAGSAPPSSREGGPLITNRYSGNDWIRNRGPLTGTGELGGGTNHLGDDHGYHEISLARGDRIDEGIKAEVADRAKHGRDMTMAKAPGDVKALLELCLWGLVHQYPAQLLYLVWWPTAQVRKRTGLDLAIFSIALS
jgi:hypothetical protein